MSSPQFRRIAFLAVAVFMVASGLVLAGQSLLQLSLGSGLPVWQKPEIFGIGGGQSAALAETSRVLSASTDTTFTDTASTDEASSYRLRAQDGLTTTPIAAATSHPLVAIPLTISYASDVPVDLLRAINTLALREGNVVTATESEVTETLHFDWDALAGSAFFTQTFVAATRFDTVDPAIDWKSLQRMWQGEPLTFTTIAILTNTLSALQQSLGESAAPIEIHETITSLLTSAWDDRTTLVLLPFDQLVPRLATLAIDGQNPLENASHFDPALYPFYATVYLHHASITDASAEPKLSEALWAQLPHTNRDPSKLTVVAVTGVTAMARLMGVQMDELGSVWPSAIVSYELASADLTVFSNEVAFSPDCETNDNPNSLLFCSKPDYWQALQSSGVDLISLTGNHVNDWGRESLAWSLDFYARQKVVVYGGGANNVEAVAPRLLEHNGNRLAFLGANSVGPEMAWSTDSLPGAARFDFAQAAQLIERARFPASNGQVDGQVDEQGADVVFYDIQYLESYNLWPLANQRNTFNMLLQFGADVVTGMQSHVPQAMEFTDGKLILYGLGNLYFDQMWGEATRQSLIAKHTVYDGRHIGSQILVTILYDYGQPHWATAEERYTILSQLFLASYW